MRVGTLQSTLSFPSRTWRPLQREEIFVSPQDCFRIFSTLDNMLDPSQIDGVVLLLDWVYLVLKPVKFFFLL